MNTIGDKGVQIFVRIFPELKFHSNLIEIFQNRILRLNFPETNKTFQICTRNIFRNHSQEAIFEEVLPDGDFKKYGYKYLEKFMQNTIIF